MQIRLLIGIYSNFFLNILLNLDTSKVDLNTYIAKICNRNDLQSFIKNRMGCQGNEFIVPTPSVDFQSNNQILKSQWPYYKNLWVYKNPTRGDDFTFWPMDYNECIFMPY